MNTIYDYSQNPAPSWSASDIWNLNNEWACNPRDAEIYYEINDEMCDLLIPDCQREMHENDNRVFREDLDLALYDPYDGYTEEDQARDLQISIEEVRDYNKSNLSWIEWLRSQEIM